MCMDCRVCVQKGKSTREGTAEGSSCVEVASRGGVARVVLKSGQRGRILENVFGNGKENVDNGCFRCFDNKFS